MSSIFFTNLCTKCNSSAGWLNCYGIWQASHLKLPNSIPVVLFLTVSAANAQTYLNYYHQIPFLTHEFSKSMKSMQPLQILNGIIYGTIQLFHKYIYKTPESIFSLRKYIISGPLVNDITKAIKYGCRIYRIKDYMQGKRKSHSGPTLTDDNVAKNNLDKHYTLIF